MPIDRRRLWLVVAVVGAVAVVAVAAGDPLTGSARAPADVVGRVATVALLAFLAAGVAVTVVALLPGKGPRGPLPKRRTWPTAVFAILLAIFIWLNGPIRRDATLEPGPATEWIEDGADGADAPSEPGPPEWGLGAIGIGLVVLAVTLSARAGRRRQDGAAEDESAADPTDGWSPPVDDDPVDAARRCADPRHAVRLAFAAAETLLGTDPATRRPPATSPREWAAAVPSAALRALVGRYEVARFSHHVVTEDDRRVALDALDAIAAAVRSPAR